jgi:hypothetical protein
MKEGREGAREEGRMERRKAKEERKAKEGQGRKVSRKTGR